MSRKRKHFLDHTPERKQADDEQPHARRSSARTDVRAPGRGAADPPWPPAGGGAAAEPQGRAGRAAGASGPGPRHLRNTRLDLIASVREARYDTVVPGLRAFFSPSRRVGGE